MSTENVLSNPLTYLDREGREGSKYFFISYSHKDRGLVYEVLNKLYDEDVNYWYDVELDPGDNWSSRVEKQIQNENHCIGSIVFLSENALRSKAIRKELEMMLEIQANREFRIVPVIIGSKKARTLVVTFFDENYKEFTQQDMNFYLDLTGKSLCVTLENVVEEIVDVAKEENAKEGSNINIRKFNQNTLASLSVNGEKTYYCGKYPFDEDGKEEDIEWKLICNTGTRFYLVSKYCIDFIAMSAIDSTIEKIKKTIHNLNKLKNVDVMLINEDFLNSYNTEISVMLPTNFADKNRQQLLRLFWVLEGNGKNKDCYKLYNSQKVRIDENIVREQINAGIRLILVLDQFC